MKVTTWKWKWLHEHEVTDMTTNEAQHKVTDMTTNKVSKSNMKWRHQNNTLRNKLTANEQEISKEHCTKVQWDTHYY